MKKKKIIAILMILFGIILIGGAFLLGNDGSGEPSEPSGGEEGVYYDPTDSNANLINLLYLMHKTEYKYKDISVTKAEILASPGINSFDGYFKNNSDKKLTDFNMTFVFYDKNDKEVYRYTDQNPEVAPGEEVMLRAETMTYLGDVVRFEIIEA